MNNERRAHNESPIYWYVALAAPAAVVVIWLLTLLFLLQSPLIDLSDLDAALQDLSTAPELPLEYDLEELGP